MARTPGARETAAGGTSTARGCPGKGRTRTLGLRADLTPRERVLRQQLPGSHGPSGHTGCIVPKLVRGRDSAGSPPGGTLAHMPLSHERLRDTGLSKLPASRTSEWQKPAAAERPSMASTGTCRSTLCKVPATQERRDRGRGARHWPWGRGHEPARRATRSLRYREGSGHEDSQTHT